MLKTEVPANVAEGPGGRTRSPTCVFGRRGPAQVKFTPLELRELGKVPDVGVIVSKKTDFDEGSEEALRASNQRQRPGEL